MVSVNRTKESGFTLVELAIALMIIGLLIGGVLKGIELVENARVTQVMRNVKAYETAMTSFQSIYSALPGDIANPATRLPNCAVASTCATSGNGNGVISSEATPPDNANVPANPDDTDEERTFWLHLAVAGLISGVDATGRVSSPFAWGVEYPASPVIGSGFMIANIRKITVAAPYVTGSRFQGHYAVLRGINPTADGVLTGNQSLQIDTKFDDAVPGSGDIFVAQTGTSATTDCVTTASYTVNSDVKSCVLFLKLSK